MKLSKLFLILTLLGTSCGFATERPLSAMDTCTKVRYPSSAGHSPEQQLDWLKKYGYAGIAWTEEDPAVVARVAKAAAERGVPMTAIYVSATLTKEKLLIDPRLPGIIKALKGRDTVLWLHILSKDFAPSAVDGDAIAVPELQRLADSAAAAGLRVAIYPHVTNWTERTDDAIRLSKAVDRPNFGVNFNLNHALRVGDGPKIASLLDAAKPWLFSVTVNGADPDTKRMILPLGRGSYDVGAFLKELDRVDFQGPVYQQGYGIGLPPEVLLAESMQAWNTEISPNWQEVTFPKSEGWLTAGGAKLDPANPSRLIALDGEGVLVNGLEGRAADLHSQEKLGDCELHLEFLVAKKSNSGVYLMSRYEVQIYDNFGVVKNSHPKSECGSIYPQWINNTSKGGHSPRVNAALPAGQWQSFDIVFRAPRFDANGKKTAPACFVKVFHNGTLVHENVTVSGHTAGGTEGEVATAALRLQGDHGPVAFRNLRYRVLPSLPASPQP